MLVTYQAECEDLLGIGSVERFWQGVSPQDPRVLSQHPALQVPGYEKIFCPLWLHGDGVEYSDDDTLMVWTFGSVLTTTNSMLTMFYLASYVKAVTAVQAKHGADTWEEIWEVLAWSFLACWTGVHPVRDHRGNEFAAESPYYANKGKDLCRGMRFVIWNLIGDLEHMANNLGMPHWRNQEICWQCNATQPEGARPAYSLGPNKLWQLCDPSTDVFASRPGC